MEGNMKRVSPRVIVPPSNHFIKLLTACLKCGFVAVALALVASPACAAITYDSSSSFISDRSTKSITWRNTIGNGPDRALVVGVSITDLIASAGDLTPVRFNNIVMHPRSASHAISRGTRVLETQAFYLTGSELPAAGTYDVVVQFGKHVAMAAGGAVSLFGVQAGAPAAAVANAKPLGAGPISTAINAPANSWVIDIVGSESDSALTPGASQTKRFNIARTGYGIAGSAQAASPTGPTTLQWDQKAPNRLVTSAVAFAVRPEFTLTLATTGAGSIQTNPSGTKFLSGTNVTLTAIPAADWQFAGWSGDLSGAINPSTITMDRNKSITANFARVAPTITTQPASQTVFAGANVGFSVAASGTPPLAFQWKKGGNNITGATAATLSLTNVQLSDAGSYTVVVSNEAGSATSNAAILTVNPPLTAPVITSQPAGRTATVGDNVSFTVGATGNPSPTFQWKKNGTDIPGKTASIISLTNVQLGDAASYTVLVTNSVTSVLSDAAVL